jgi:hypothetical protein
VDVYFGVQDPNDGVGGRIFWGSGPKRWGWWTYILGFRTLTLGLADVYFGVQDPNDGVGGRIFWGSGP